MDIYSEYIKELERTKGEEEINRVTNFYLKQIKKKNK